MNIDIDDSGGAACPHCLSHGRCEHLLLVVDSTFREASGGALMKAFNQRWSVLCEMGGDGFMEREAFDALLDEVSDLADSCVEEEVEGGPGMSSQFVIFHAETAEKFRSAVEQFEAR